MDFKIDTKETYTTIMPHATEINAILSGELRLKIEEVRQSGSGNIIVDLQNCTGIDEQVVPELLILHEESYSMEHSLVFTEANDAIIAVLRKSEADLMLNIAPRMIEAIDIISMEILERDLLSEE